MNVRSRNRPKEIAAMADLKAGIALHQAGQLDEAEAIYRQVLKAAPNSGETLHLLGLVSHDRGDSARAMQFIQRALEATPESAAVHLSLGNLLRASDQLDAATKSYRRAIALKPDFAHAHCNLASALSRQGLHEEALESAARAVELMPDLAEAHFNRAAALARRRRFVDAEAAFRKVLALQPDNAAALTELGQVVAELKRFDEAIGIMRRAVELQPDKIGAYLPLAATLVMAMELDASEAAWRKAIDLAPNSARAWAGLGTTMRVVGRFDEARVYFERALALDPDLSDAHGGLAVIGQLPSNEAHVDRLRALAASPEVEIEHRVWLSFALGTMLDNAGRYDEAFSSFAEGNAAHRERLAGFGEIYDHAALERQVTGLIQRSTPRFIRPSNRRETRQKRRCSLSACRVRARAWSSRSPRATRAFRARESSAISPASAIPCSRMDRGARWMRWTLVWRAGWRTIMSRNLSGWAREEPASSTKCRTTFCISASRRSCSPGRGRLLPARSARHLSFVLFPPLQRADGVCAGPCGLRAPGAGDRASGGPLAQRVAASHAHDRL
jgi:tetratricopeptide (TPR) repeat protein